MEQHIKAIGILLVLLAVIHVSFPRYFKWKTELNAISHINRQMMYIHTLFIAFVVFLMGVLCLTSTAELVATPLGKKVSLGIGVFWTARLFVQFFGYSSSHWKGKKFETVVHIVFSALWVYFSGVFIYNYFN
jgi:hypothetical protein